MRIVHCINAVETSKAIGRDSGTRSKYWTTSFLLIFPNFFCLPSVNKSPSVVTSYLRNRNLVDYLLRRTFSCCWSSLWPWSLVVSLLPNIHGSTLTTTPEIHSSCSRLVHPQPRNRPSDAPFLAALVSLSATCRLLRRRFSKTPQTLVPTTQVKVASGSTLSFKLPSDIAANSMIIIGYNRESDFQDYFSTDIASLNSFGAVYPTLTSFIRDAMNTSQFTT